MKGEILEYQTNYQIAALGNNGHNIILAGETSVTGRLYIAVKALEDSVFSYSKGDVPFNTFGDASVSNLALSKGDTLLLGSSQDINVVSGKLFAILLNRP